MGRIVNRITSGPRTLRRTVKRSRLLETDGKADHTAYASAKNELDTRADTICAGINFRMLYSTGQVCDVRGFHDDFDSIKDVPVATVATGYRNEHGQVYILIIHEALYFGPGLDHSLINPNQIRHNGIVVSDDPYDSSRQFGIDHDHLFIPFRSEGCTVFFETFVPSDQEVDTCPHVILTDGEREWDPSTVQMSGDRPYGDISTATELRQCRERIGSANVAL